MTSESIDPPYGIEIKFRLRGDKNWRNGRTAHLCDMDERGLHEVVVLATFNTGKRVFFLKEIRDWKKA